MVTISGGEPTVHKKYPEIVQRLAPHGIVETITNAARPLNWWKSLPQLPHDIIISLHPEYYDAKQMRINELSEFFIDSGVILRYNLCCDPKHWDQVIAIENSIDEKFKNRIIPKLLFDYDDSNTPMHPYTDEHIKFIKSFDLKNLPGNKNVPVPRRTFSDGTVNTVHSSQLIANELNKFNGWKCSAGSAGIDIRANGNVYAGICNIRLLGRISNFKLLDEFLICSKDICPCPGDINLPKYRLRFG